MTLSPKIPSILIMPFLDSFIIMCLSIDHAYFEVKVKLTVFILVDLGKTKGGKSCKPKLIDNYLLY
jgi:hypothetical protein